MSARPSLFEEILGAREYAGGYVIEAVYINQRLRDAGGQIYQRRETVFHRDIQTPRKELKIRRAFPGV